MSAKSNNSKASLQQNCKTKSQKSVPKMDLKECLKMLEKGDFHLINVEDVRQELSAKPQLADNLQYELHNYCKKNVKSKVDSDVIVKLAKLCYSPYFVSLFSNMDRFVGCAYYISVYLLKKGKYKAALDLVSNFTIKKEEIIEASNRNPDIINFLYNLHSNMIESAIVLSSNTQNKADKLPQELALESVKLFHLTNTLNLQVGKKVIKTTRMYLHTVKHHNDEDIAQFYRTSSQVLQSLVTGLSDFDYASYCLCKMDQIKGLDFSKGVEIHNNLKRTIHMISVMLRFPVTVKFYLDSLLDLFFSTSQDKLWFDEECINYFLEVEKGGELYFLIICKIFNHGIQFWWKTYEDDWLNKISSSLIQKLFTKIIQLTECHYKNQSFYCSSSTKILSETCFGDLLTGNLHAIQYTVRLCMKNKVPKCLPLVSLSRKAFKLSLDCLAVMKSSGCNADRRGYAWKHSVIHYTNTIEDILRNPPSEETWMCLRDSSEELLKEVVNAEFDLPYESRRVGILFQRWHHAVLKLQQYYEGLYICVLYYVCFPQDETEIMSMWLMTKSEACNDILAEKMMSEVLKSCDSGIKQFNPKYGTSVKVNMKDLLMMELKAYSSCPSDTFKKSETSYNLVFRIWKHLEKLNLDLWETSFALTCLVSTSIYGDDDKLPKMFKDKCNDVISKLMYREVEGKKQCRSLLHAANLSFALFLWNVKMAENSEGVMETSKLVLGYLKKVQEENVKFGEDVDLNLTCNVIPSSSQLTVELETNYLNSLNEVVELWQKALKSKLDDRPSKCEFDSWLHNVKQVAQMYELVGEYQRSFTTWLLFYKISKTCDDSAAILCALSHLIENVSNVDDSELMAEAEGICGKLESDPKEKSTLIEFWLAVASNYLKNKEAKKCLEQLSKVKRVLGSLRNSIRTYTLNAKYWCIVSQFLCLYPNFEVEFGYEPGTDLRIFAFVAFSYANAGARNDLVKSATQAECTELVLAMLEVNLWGYYFHGIYSQTDFMRLFLDDLYQIVQKLFLPTRTAEMLVRLAEVDMMCEKVADCQGKVTKLKSILTTLSSSGCVESSKPEKSVSPYLPIPEKNNVENQLLRPVSPVRFLDKPLDSRERDPSPIHYHLSDVKSTKSAKHLKKCKCRLCQNLLIQILTMNTLCLEAEIHKMESCSKKAAACYSQAFDTMNKLEHLRAEQCEILSLELVTSLKTGPEELDFRLRPVQFQMARFLIKYAFFESCALNSVTDNVKIAMEKVSKLMKKFSYEEKLLLWTFSELKLLSVVLSKKEEVKPAKKNTPIEFKSNIVTATPFPEHRVPKIPSRPLRGKGLKIPKTPFAVKPKGNKIICDVEEDEKEKEEEEEDEINIAFIDDKTCIHPKKLYFHSNELETESKTVIKAPKERASYIKPRRLVLDEMDSEDETKSGSDKMKANSKKEMVSGGSVNEKKVLRSTIKVHVDSSQGDETNSKRKPEAKGKKTSVAEKRILPGRGKKTDEGKDKKPEAKTQNVSIDLFS